MARSLLVLSGGHPYEAGPFDELLTALGDWEITHLVHPEGGEADAAEAILAADALLFYDMAGYSFGEGTVTTRPPSPALREALTSRFASGKGAVAMHHALAGWAEWPEWHDWLGGQFHYQPGAHWVDSGYRHDVAYEARVVAGHPVTRGLPASFTVSDELYLCPIDERALTHSTWDKTTVPIVYTRDIGAGRIVYNALGHCRGHYDLPGKADFYPHKEMCAWNYDVYYDLLRRTIAWAMRDGE